eukprot:m.199540 g.199540  ORF g.199540 m.199540 type:complete len:631 (-) comp25918_c0_seq3:106-1998(-)
MLLLFVFCCCLCVCVGHPTGADSSSCSSGVPGTSPSHGTQQTGSGDFTYTFDGQSITEYTPGQKYSATLSGSNLGGFLIYLSGSTPGTIEGAGDANLQTGPCIGEISATHTNPNLKASVQFTWTAPSSGDVTFRTTVVAPDRSKFWLYTTELKPNAKTDCSKAPDCSKIDRVDCNKGTVDNTCGACLDGYYDITNSTQPSNLDDCKACDVECAKCEFGASYCTQCRDGYHKQGNTCVKIPARDYSKGSSLSFPNNCKGDACTYHVQWGTQDNVMNFRLRAKTNGWVAVGFSSSRSMPNSDIYVGYIDTESRVLIDNRYATAKSTPAVDSPQADVLSFIAGERSDGFLEVEFSRTLASTSDKDIDMTTSASYYYMLVAQGPAVFGEHPASGQSNGPILSDSKVNLHSTAPVSASLATKASTATIAHGSLMIAAWVGFAPVGTFMARFLKYPLGAPLWFNLHFYVQIFVVMLTVISMIIVLANVEFQWEGHQLWGVILLVLTGVQIILGLSRNLISGKTAESTDQGPRRGLFNWSHRIVGFLTFLVSAFVIIQGLNIISAQALAKKFMFAWLGMVLATLLVVEPMNFVRKQSGKEKKLFWLEVGAIYVSLCAAAAITLIFIVAHTSTKGAEA